MYIIPGSKKRAFVASERDTTIKMATTEWGKRRAERFFAHFMETGTIAYLAHPIAAFRYWRLPDKTVDVRERDLVSSDPLTSYELRYVDVKRKISFEYRAYDGADRRALMHLEYDLRELTERLKRTASGNSEAASSGA